MKRSLTAFFVLSLLALSVSAETFEQVIETQPPETEKNFFGVTDMVLSKTNNFLDGVLGVLTGVNEGNFNSILEGFQKSTDTFRKYRDAHKEALGKQMAAKEDELASVMKSGAKGEKLSKAYLEAGRAAMAAGEYAKARENLAQALKIADEFPETARKMQFDILLAMADCAYDSYDTEYMLNVRNQIENLTADPAYGTINQRVNSLLASARADMRLGNSPGALNELGKAYELAMTDKSFDMADPVFNQLQIEILKKFPDLGFSSEGAELLNNMLGSNSSLRDRLMPEQLAQMYVVRADCHSRMGENSKAFDDIFKARDIIQKAHPEGSEAELEYLVTLGDIIRRNSLSKGGGIRNRYTDKGATYYLNGCRILASRIWGDEKEGVNPWLRRVNGKLALAAVTDCIINGEEMKKYSAPSFIKTAQVLADKATYSSSEEQYLKYSRQADESLKFARKLYKSELDYMRGKIRRDFTSMDEGQRADYMAAMSELVNDIYNFAELDKKDKEMAGMVYDATLLSKSVLLSFSRSLGSSVKAMGDPALTAMLDEFNARRRDYVRLEQQGDFTAAADVRRQAGELERKLQHAVSASNPGEFMTTTWKDVKKGLGKIDAAAEFYTFTDNLYGTPGVRERIVAVAANKNPHVFTLRYKEGEVPITAPGQPRMLYMAIWQPLEKEKFLKPGGTVYFAPAGRWNGVPLEYLPTGKEDMNDRYRMVRVSSTRSKPATSRPVFDHTILFGGLDYNLDIDEMAAIRDDIAETGMRGPLASGLWNHLPGTETEVENIAEILSGNNADCIVVTGADGIEEKFKSLSGEEHGIVHIATHGYYTPPVNSPGLRSESVKMDEAMDNSGLVFSGANQYLAGVKGDDEYLDDGLLTAREISLMDLSSTDLVVMSACETGTGRATSEGVLGLQRGFKLAGVNTLVMSLWKVNDQATAAMMEAFYRHLSEGMGKRAAFYAARADLRKGTYKGSDGSDIPGTDPLIGDAFVIMD